MTFAHVSTRVGSALEKACFSNQSVAYARGIVTQCRDTVLSSTNAAANVNPNLENKGRFKEW